MQPIMREFQLMKAKAYSNLSLKRPLTDSEFKEYKAIMGELGGNQNVQRKRILG